MVTYDDLDPCYLPNGRICFSSSRYPGIAPDLRGRTTNLYVVEGDGTALHRITTERYGADTPSVDPQTGEIVYARWWRSNREVKPSLVEAGKWAPPPPPPLLEPGPVFESVAPSDFSGPNSWFLASIHPDGTELSMYAGFRFDRDATQAWRPSFLPDGTVAVLFPTETPFAGRPGEGKGLRIFTRGIGVPRTLGGPRNFEGAMKNAFVYASVAALPDGRLLVSAARTSDTPDFDLYVQSTNNGTPQRVHGTFLQELDATPIVARDVPPVIEDKAAPRTTDEVYMTIDDAYERGGSFRFLVENIFTNAPVDFPLASAPPLGKDLTIEFYMAPQLQSVGPRDLPILIDKQRIPSSGKIDVELPAGVPLFEVLRTPDGDLVQSRDGQVYHVGGQNFGQAGATARCVGCHTGHSTMAVPDDVAWTNLATSADIEVSKTRPGSASVPDRYRPENLVDRDTTIRVGDWVGVVDTRGDHWFSLAWGETLEVRELVLYSRDQNLASLNVSLRQDQLPATTIPVEGPFGLEGTRIPLAPGTLVDSLRVDLDVGSETFVTMTEIEVIARSSASPLVAFRRGDADCNAVIDLTDASRMFGGLFRNAGFCCEAAADVDTDGRVNLADPLFLLNYLFLNGPTPEAPFERCGESASGLACTAEGCV